ncbi:hypothetical protein F5I97DRAFT_1930496 [Phlebopus sp. FC_14]|nr:hypothetical protein F5I97DRAFT_1930496 [Phlebopus sp. FC_14]
MNISLLASFSLFALVVTSRPLSPSDLQLDLRSSSESEGAIQAVFQVYPGTDELILDRARVQYLAAEQQDMYIPQSDAESIEASASFGIIPGQKASVEETFLNEPIDGSQGDSDNPDPLLDVDAEGLATLMSVVTLPADGERSSKSNNDEPSLNSLLVLAFSCVAAFSALVCIALTLYVDKHLRSRILTSQTAWHLLPRIQKLTTPSLLSQTAHSRSGDQTLSGNTLPLQIGGPHCLGVEDGVLEKHGLLIEEKHIYFDAVSDIQPEWDDVEENYEDALATIPLPPTYALPPNGHGQSLFTDPPLPYAQFESSLLPRPQANHIVTTTREVAFSPVSRPAWSVRATDSPPLGLTPLEASVDFHPQAFVHSRRRAYRAVPEFDVALAMQLRPGFGTGADSAWMVRFLMAIFGWFAVALAGNR